MGETVYRTAETSRTQAAFYVVKPPGCGAPDRSKQIGRAAVFTARIPSVPCQKHGAVTKYTLRNTNLSLE